MPSAAALGDIPLGTGARKEETWGDTGGGVFSVDVSYLLNQNRSNKLTSCSSVS